MNVDLKPPTFHRTPDLPARRCGLCQSLKYVSRFGVERPFCFVKGYTHELRCCDCFELKWEAQA